MGATTADGEIGAGGLMQLNCAQSVHREMALTAIRRECGVWRAAVASGARLDNMQVQGQSVDGFGVFG